MTDRCSQICISWKGCDTNSVCEGFPILRPCVYKRKLWPENTFSFSFHFFSHLLLHESEGMIFLADKTMGLDSHSSSSLLGWSEVYSACSPVDTPGCWGEACAPACRGAKPAFCRLSCLCSADHRVGSSKSLHLQLTGEGSALRTPFWSLGWEGDGN